jgi:hypothetical protein
MSKGAIVVLGLLAAIAAAIAAEGPELRRYMKISRM